MREPHSVDLAQAAVADPLARLAAAADGAILGTHLDNPAITSRRLDHLPALVDRPAERLLAIDVLARLAGQHGDGGVPVVGRGHEHGVDVLAVEDAAKILVGIALSDPVLGGGQVLPVHVAHRRDGTAGVVVNGQQVRAPPSTAHQRGDHPFAGRPSFGSPNRVRGNEVRYGEAQPRRAEETAPAQQVFPSGHASLLIRRNGQESLRS